MTVYLCEGDLEHILCGVYEAWTSRRLGMVRQWQTLFYGKRYSQTVLNDNVDYVKLSEAMGATAYRVTQKEEFAKIFQEAMGKEGPVVIDCQIGCDDKVFPMVSPGAPIADAFDDTDLKIQ